VVLTSAPGTASRGETSPEPIVHVVPSVAFSILAGLGFGLMAWLGMLPTGHPGWVAAVFAVLGFALVGSALLGLRGAHRAAHRASPAGAPRALWAGLAGATAAAFGLYVAVWLAFDARPPLLGGLVAALAIATMAATATLCARLGAGPCGPAALTHALFVASGLAGGALLAGASGPAKWSLAALALLEPVHWFASGRAPAAPREARARKALALRLAGLACAALLPLALLLAFPFKHGLAALVVALHLVGMVVLRWLLFAPAGHSVGLGPGTRYG
jgi:sulfite dehydrogenase (quinone) subunit SoeC